MTKYTVRAQNAKGGPVRICAESYDFEQAIGWLDNIGAMLEYGEVWCTKTEDGHVITVYGYKVNNGYIEGAYGEEA